MLWLSLAWATAISVVILLGIGFPLARLIGLRGFTAWAVAPAFAMTMVCTGSVILPWLGIPWSIWAVIGVAVITAGMLFGVLRLTRRTRPAPLPPRRFDPWLLIAFLVAATLITLRMAAVIQAPDHISQTFDNVFHLNAIRWMLDNGSASSFQVGLLTSPEGPAAFYPAGWHALVALVVQVSGVSIPVAVNAVTITVSAVVWPLGILLLSRTLLGTAAALTVSVGVVSASVPGFPLAMNDYGVLYPFQLGLALLPVALALTARVLRLGPTRDSLGTLWWCIALGAVLAGQALVHPGGVMAWLALSAAMTTVFVVTRWRTDRRRAAHVKLVVGTVAYLAISAAMVIALRAPAAGRGWQPEMSVNAALVKVMTAAPWYSHAPLVVAVGVLVGAICVLFSRKRSVVATFGLYVIAAILFVVAASIPFPYRDLVTASWYNNIPRLAAILSVAIVPMAAYGLSRSWAYAARIVRRRGWSRRQLRAAGVITAAVVGVALQVGPLSAMPEAQRVATGSFTLSEDSPMLSSSEYALLQRLDDHVPPGAVIAGSPWTGTSLAYALTGRRVLMPHILMDVSDELMLINDELAEAEPGSAVCAAMNELGVKFVLDFGTREVHGANHDFPGFDDLADSPAVRLVDSEGSARLYEVTACQR